MKFHLSVTMAIEAAARNNLDCINMDNFKGIRKLEDIEELIVQIYRELSFIKKLSICSSDLESLTPKIGILVYLENLQLNNNNLENLPNSIKKLTKLGQLSLRNNNIKDIPDVLESLPQNCIVDLRENPLSLKSLLKISTGTKIMYLLDDNHRATLDKIKSSSEDRDIAVSISNAYPTTSIEEFITLLPLVKAELELTNIIESSEELDEITENKERSVSDPRISAIEKVKIKFDKSKSISTTALDTLGPSLYSALRTVTHNNTEPDTDSLSVPLLNSEIDTGNRSRYLSALTQQTTNECTITKPKYKHKKRAYRKGI